MASNVGPVIRQMKVDNQFWRNFPIYIEESPVSVIEEEENKLIPLKEGVNPMRTRVKQEVKTKGEPSFEPEVQLVKEKTFIREGNFKEKKNEEKFFPDPKDLNDDVSNVSEYRKVNKISKIRSIQFSPLGKRS